MSNEYNRKLAVSIGSSARRARKHLELTQQDVAEQVDVSVEFYARIERGHALPSIRTFDRLVSALHVSADTLLGSSETATGTVELRASAPPWSESPEIRQLLRHLRKAPPSRIRFVTRLVSGLERIRAPRGEAGEPGPDDSAPARREPGTGDRSGPDGTGQDAP